MKKLKLRTLEVGDAEVLTREQLKNVFGGVGDGSTCTMTYQDTSGQWHTQTGSCQTAVYNWGSGFSGISSFRPYCQTASFTEPATLSSNGGVSKCGSIWEL